MNANMKPISMNQWSRIKATNITKSETDKYYKISLWVVGLYFGGHLLAASFNAIFN